MPVRYRKVLKIATFARKYICLKDMLHDKMPKEGIEILLKQAPIGLCHDELPKF